ncbi:MAG: lipocalin family protein [Bacteroidota bacterium]
MKGFYAILISLSVLFVSCKKNNDDPGFATAAKIQGKWQIDSVTINQHLNGTTNKQTIAGSAADYINFGTDGNMETNFKGNKNVSAYKVKSDTIITIEGDSGYIEELTDTKLRLYTKAEAGGIGYMETIYYLSR